MKSGRQVFPTEPFLTGSGSNLHSQCQVSAFNPMLHSLAVHPTSPHGACYFAVLLIFNFTKTAGKICQQITAELEEKRSNKSHLSGLSTQ